MISPATPMTERFQLAQDLFEAVLGADEHQREEILNERTRDDPDLRRQVEDLLRAHARAEQFLETPAARIDPAAADDADVGRLIGAYRLIDRLGTGGMGTVYLAERADAEYEKRVAIKLIKRGMDTDDILRRFRTERQVLATLDHPNIARLLDGGATDDGRPYLVMELVQGEPINEHCDRLDLSIDDRLRLFGQVCRAVHYAHQNLVIHRDLKPSNTLVTPDGTVKLLDFGIAKVLERRAGTPLVTTEAERSILTPRYASPEQIRAERVTTATDVYSLGIMLYELLTGEPAYDVNSDSREALERAVCEQQPMRPSTRISRDTPRDRARSMHRRLRGDLDTIVLKAIRKEPARRYASVQELSEDLRRFLAGLPVSARPDSIHYRATKFVQRHAIGVGVVTGVVVLLLVATIVSTSLFVEANTQRRTAERVSGLVQEMFESIEPASALGRDVSLIRAFMDRMSRRIDAELADEPRVASEMHLTLGVAYLSINEFASADEHLNEALRLRESLFPARHTEIAEAHYQLGRLHFHRSQFDDGDARFRQALSIYRQRRDREGVARTLNSLGILLQMSGGYAESEACYLEALDVLDASHRAPTTGHADVLNSLGQLLMWRNRVDEAEAPLRRAVRIQRDLQGDDHPDAVIPMLNLARWHIRKKHHHDAGALLEAALAICESTLDRTDPTRSQVLAELADHHAALEQYARAIELYREVLDIDRQVYGDEHMEIGTTSNNLGGLLRRAGELDDAEVLFKEALDVYRLVLGPDHFWCSIVSVNLAKLYIDTERCAEADDAIDEAIRIRRLHPDSGAWWISDAESLRADCLIASGDYEAAEAILLRCLPVVEEHLGAEHETTMAMTRRLVDLYDQWGQVAKADQWRERLGQPIQ